MKTLAELQKKTEKRTSDGPKREFLQLSDGQFFKVRFRQEMSEDASNYDAEKGTALVVSVHSNPLDFKKKLGCTAESEEHNFQCWACEQTSENKKWYPKTRFYINVAVLGEDGTWENKVLEQGFGDSHVGPLLIEFASEYGSITDREYKFKRTGKEMNDTNYTLTPLKEGKEPKEFGELPLNSFEGLVRYLPYDQQEDYFYGRKTESTQAWAN
jgi:hypothetical protein